jgi:hypothetical protein
MLNLDMNLTDVIRTTGYGLHEIFLELDFLADELTDRLECCIDRAVAGRCSFQFRSIYHQLYHS